VNNINIIWEGSLPGSERGNLGKGAQSTKVNSFLKKCVIKTNSIWAGSLPGSGRGNLGEEPRQQKVNRFITSPVTPNLYATPPASGLGGFPKLVLARLL